MIKGIIIDSNFKYLQVQNQLLQLVNDSYFVIIFTHYDYKSNYNVMSLSIDLIKTFIVFATSKNIYEAANTLGLSQPSVTLQLKRVEDYFDTTLFNLDGKKKILNSHGKTIFEELKDIVIDLDNRAIMLKRSFKDYEKLTLKIACRKEFSIHLLDNCNFDGKLKFYSRSSTQSMQMLDSNQVDFALVHTDPKKPKYLCQKVFTMGAHFLIPKSKYPICPTIDELTKDHFLTDNLFLMYNDNDYYLGKWLKYFKFPLEKIKVKLTIDDWDVITQLVEDNKGIALTPESFGNNNPNLWKIPVSHNIISPTNFYIVQKEENKSLFPLEEICSL